MLFKKAIFAISTSLLIGGTMPASSGGFDPRQPCSVILGDADETTLAMVGAWTFGYLASKQSDTRPVDLDNVGVILRNLNNNCLKNGTRSLLDLVSGNADAAPGSEAQARALLMKFYDPNADLVALTAALFPTEQEVHMVYSDPLASAMVANYAAAFKPGLKFGPKPEHNDLLVVYATTGQLQRGDDILREFPGGYKDVVQYFKTDVPIVRFKFITKGETLGLAFDGLIYVNDHWVIMPKPWRSLK